MARNAYGNFVRTSNVQRFMDGLDALEARAAPESSFMVVTGEWGLGKTRLAQYHATQNALPFVRIKAAATPHWVLADLVKELGEPPAYSCENLHAQAIGILAKAPRALIFDEVENGLHDSRVIESIRDVADIAEVPVVLVGREFVGARLKRLPAVWSRVSAQVHFQRLDAKDMRLLLRERGPAEVDDALMAQLLADTEGRIRLAVAAVKRLAPIARRKARRLTPEDVRGIDLVKAVARERAEGAPTPASPQEAA